MPDVSEVHEYDISFSDERLPFYEGGRLVFVIKLKLPHMTSENKVLESSFNGLYESIKNEYIALADSHKRSFVNLTRPATLKVESSILTTNVDKIEIKRTAELRTDIKRRKTEYTDSFDAALGVIIKPRRK